MKYRLLLCAMLLTVTGCGLQVPASASGVSRVRFTDDKVTCYVITDAISCLRDPEIQSDV